MAFSERGSTTLAVTTTSARVALPDRFIQNSGNPAQPPIIQSNVVRVLVDPGTLAAADKVYVVIGDASIVATAANGVPIIPGIVEYYNLLPTDTHIAAIATANGSTLNITVGGEKR